MSKQYNDKLTYEEILETDIIHRTIIYCASYVGIIIYIISFLIMLLYVKKISFIKSHSFSFILLNSITNLTELTTPKKNLITFKNIIVFISYLFQFHLIVSSFNRMLSGKQIFKSEKDFSLKKLIYIEIVLPLIILPYGKFFDNSQIINFFHYLVIIILLLCFYEYIKNKINKVIQYINESNKDIIEIAYMEQEDLIRIYRLLKNLWDANFFFGLIFYVVRFFDILLIEIDIIHYGISIILLSLRELIVFLFFGILTTIVYLLNNYNKGQRIQTDEEDNQFSGGNKIKFDEDEEENGKINKKDEDKKIEIELDDINIERNKKKDEYKNIENSQNEDNIIEIENLEISNGKENNHNEHNEEEKLDEEEENLKINKYHKETDKLK